MPKAAAQSRSYLHPILAQMMKDGIPIDWSKVCDIYARVSRATDERYRSTEGQVQEAVDQLLDVDLIPGWVHVDDSLSAWNERIKRIAWETMMERLESGKTGGIMVWNLTRFTRRVRDGERLIEAAERGLLVLDSDGTWDLANPRRKKEFRNAIADAAYYSDELAKNVSRGKRTKARNGEMNTSVRPFGLTASGELHPMESKIVRQVVKDLLAGKRGDTVIADLNARGITTTRGNEWTRPALKAMLLRQSNIGIVVHKGNAIGRLVAHETLIQKADYDLVRALYDSRRRGSGQKYLLSGLVRCAECTERRLYARPLARYRAYPDGSPRRAYVCNGGDGPKGCSQQIDQRFLERQAKELAIAMLTDSRNAEQIEAIAAETSTTAGQLDEEIRRWEQSKVDLASKAAEWGLDAVSAAMQPILSKLKALHAEKESLGGHAAQRKVAHGASVLAWLERYDKAEGDLSLQRSMLDTAFDGAVLWVSRGRVYDMDVERVDLRREGVEVTGDIGSSPDSLG